jgi:hypothetical protein
MIGADDSFVPSAGPLRLGDGTTLAADRYVFACGPWLGRLFPALIGDWVRPTRQETFVFGPAPGDARFTDDALPVWVDLGERVFYGVPAGGGRGFKVADDTRGAEFDPTAGDRTPSAAGAAAARAFVARRFPALATAPLVEASVCQYENTPDRRFIVDRHPHAANVFIVGGGSGHGFKMGPALGEMVAEMVLEQRPAAPAALSSGLDDHRLDDAPPADPRVPDAEVPLGERPADGIVIRDGLGDLEDAAELRRAVRVPALERRLGVDDADPVAGRAAGPAPLRHAPLPCCRATLSWRTR